MRAPKPTSRGPITQALFDGWATGIWAEPSLDGVDALTDDDFHLALWSCYQLHHGGFVGMADDLEWDLDTLRFRASLEAAFEQALRDEHRGDALPSDPVTALRVIDAWSGPPLASTLGDSGSRWQLSEFAVHRSAYQLKEADGHTWAIPRLSGRTKSAVVEIQSDEYGNGEPGRSHAELFAAAMDELGLDAGYGAYVDRLPGTTLATDNLVSLFALNGRLRGALVGHLAHFELSSPSPMAQYYRAARRLGLSRLARFYEVHVEADAHHGQLALTGVVEPLVSTEPDLAPEVSFGAAALNRVEARFSRHILDSWERGASSLRRLPTAVGRSRPARSLTAAGASR
jgi:hypothetical protein